MILLNFPISQVRRNLQALPITYNVEAVESIQVYPGECSQGFSLTPSLRFCITIVVCR